MTTGRINQVCTNHRAQNHSLPITPEEQAAELSEETSMQNLEAQPTPHWKGGCVNEQQPQMTH